MNPLVYKNALALIVTDEDGKEELLEKLNELIMPPIEIIKNDGSKAIINSASWKWTFNELIELNVSTIESKLFGTLDLPKIKILTISDDPLTNANASQIHDYLLPYINKEYLLSIDHTLIQSINSHVCTIHEIHNY